MDGVSGGRGQPCRRRHRARRDRCLCGSEFGVFRTLRWFTVPDTPNLLFRQWPKRTIPDGFVNASQSDQPGGGKQVRWFEAGSTDTTDTYQLCRVRANLGRHERVQPIRQRWLRKPGIIDAVNEANARRYSPQGGWRSRNQAHDTDYATDCNSTGDNADHFTPCMD